MRTLSFLLLLITGLALALPGGYLAMLGGSLYYVIAGVLILISAFLVLRGSLRRHRPVLAGAVWPPLPGRSGKSDWTAGP